MFAILHALGTLLVDLFKSQSRLGAENLFLRHQLTIALRQAPPRRRLRGSDRALLLGMTRLWPSLLGLAQVVQPETILRWHRAGFKMYWRWKSRNRAGRPQIDRGLRDLIQRMSRENPLVRRDLRRCNFVCLYIFCNGQVGNNCERLFRCSQNNCERPLFRYIDLGASRARTRQRCVPEPRQETTLHHGESSHGRHHRWGGVDV